MSRKWLPVLLIAGGLAAAVAIWQSGDPPPQVPEITTGHLHPLVQQAIAETLVAVEADRTSAQTWGELGMVLNAHELHADARECLSRAARLDPEDPFWPYLLGTSLELVDFDAAREQYERALQLKPDYVPLRLRLARLLMRLGMLERCEQVLAEAVRLEPENPYALLEQGRSALLQGDQQRAAEAFEAAAAREGWLPQPALQELAALAARRGDHEAAYRYQSRLSQLPEVSKAEAPDPLLEESRRFEGLGKSLARRADLALARGDYPAAIAAYRSFLARRDDMPTPYINLAQAYRLSGQLQDAITVYQQIEQQFGASQMAHVGLAQLYQQAGRADLAIRHYRAALEFKPDDRQVLLALGMLLEESSRTQEALDTYRRAVAVDPSYPQAQLALGVLLMSQKNYDQAREHIQRSAALVPGDPVPEGYLRQLEELDQAAPDGGG